MPIGSAEMHQRWPEISTALQRAGMPAEHVDMLKSSFEAEVAAPANPNPFTGAVGGGRTVLQGVGDFLLGFAGQGDLALKYQQQRQQQQTGNLFMKIAQQAQGAGKNPAAAILNSPEVLELMGTPEGMQQLQGFQKLLEGGEVEAPETRKIREGNEEVAQEYDAATGEWREVGRGSAFAPPQPAPVVNVTNMAETEREKALGKAQGERLAATSAESKALRQRSQTVGMMKSMLKDGRLQTGAGANIRVMMKKALDIDLGEDADDLQAFDQLSKGLILEAQALQKGSQTESDRAVIAATVPSINKSSRANQLSIEIIEAQDKRLQEELHMEQQLLQGGLDPYAVDAAIAEHFARRPMFNDDIVARAKALSGGTGQPYAPRDAGAPPAPQAPKAPLTPEQLQKMSIEEITEYYGAY